LIAALPPERAAAAFTHTSWAGERSDSYERLEFLGDSVLELALAHELYDRFPDFDEGQMAKIRSHVVSRASCAVVAQELGLGERLIEAGADAAGGELARLAGNRNILAAVPRGCARGALPRARLRGDRARGRRRVRVAIDYALTNQVDHKTELQETLARSGRSVSYALLNADGPPHNRVFTSAAVIDGEEAGVGRGRSKKDAEQNAAREALSRLALLPQ
jgi:ribonuclease-3